MSSQDQAQPTPAVTSTRNPGVTTYDPDAIESYQFCVSSKCGDLLVGVNGKELVGFAVEKEAPSTTFFFETLEQIARCVAICKVSTYSSSNGSNGSNGDKKEWIVAVGGDQKFVDIYTVSLDGHVSRCQAFGRIGPFPKRIQAVAVLNEEKRLLLVADRFGDIYHVHAYNDAKPELITKRSGSLTPRRLQEQSVSSNTATTTTTNNNNNNLLYKRADEHPHLRFALQHLGLVSAMRVIPATCPNDGKNAAVSSDFSPLIVSCDVDSHVRVSCGRRPGLLLQNLWPEVFSQRDQVPQPSNNNNNSANSEQNNTKPSFFTSTAGNTVSCISYFANDSSPASSVRVVTGRCDGTLSAWNLVRRDVEHLDLNGTATCNCKGPSPIVSAACLKLGNTELVVFAKADSDRLHGWIVRDSASSSTNQNNSSSSNRRSAPEASQPQSSFEIKKVKDSHVKQRMSNATSSVDSSNNVANDDQQQQQQQGTNTIVGLFGCSAMSPTAVIVVFRDATVELFDINLVSNNGEVEVSCRPVPFPASGSHTRVPLPFSAESRRQLSQARVDAVYSIVSDQMITESWQSKYCYSKNQKDEKKAAKSKKNNGDDENDEVEECNQD